MLLLNFVRLGEFAALSLADALNQSGLNLTQAMICWHMSTLDKSGKTGSVTLTDLAVALHMSQPRLHNQLQELRRTGIIELSGKSDELDRRRKFFQFTEEGRRRTGVFLAAAKLAEEVVSAEMRVKLIPRRAKDLDKWIAVREQFIQDHLGSI